MIDKLHMSFYNFNKLLQFKNLNKLENGNRKLIHVRIEPTEVCNFQCKFCVTQNPERKKIITSKGYDGGKRKFDFFRLMDLLDELKELDVKAISFVAVGDPLMYPNIDKILKKSTQLGFKLGLTSNFAMNLKDDVIETLTKFQWLRWSMNGGSKDIYMKTNNPLGKAGSNAYENVKKNISRIISKKKGTNSKTLINASYVVSEWNENDLVNATKLGSDLEIDNIFFRPDMEAQNARRYEPLNILSRNQPQFLEAKKLANKNFQVHVEHQRENDVLKSEDDDLVCFYSNHSLYIAANGDVYPCCFTRINKKYVVGNIANQNFIKFWKDTKNCNHYKNLNINSCPSCPYTKLNSDLKNVYENKPIKYKEIDKNKIDYFV